MKKCPKSLSGKHKFIYCKEFFDGGSSGYYITGIGSYGAREAKTYKEVLDNPECKYCELIDDRK